MSVSNFTPGTTQVQTSTLYNGGQISVPSSTTDTLALLNATQTLQAKSLTTTSNLQSVQSSSGTTVLSTQVSGDTNNRLTINANGNMIWGSGSATGDTRLYRTANHNLTLDNNAGGSAILFVDTLNSLQTNGNLLLIANGSGNIYMSNLVQNLT